MWRYPIPCGTCTSALTAKSDAAKVGYPTHVALPNSLWHVHFSSNSQVRCSKGGIPYPCGATQFHTATAGADPLTCQSRHVTCMHARSLLLLQMAATA